MKVNKAKIPGQLLIISVLSYVIMAAIVFLFPVGFSGYMITDISTPFWIAVTSTAGFYGGSVFIICLLIYLLIHFHRSSRKKRLAWLFMGIVFGILIIMTVVTLVFIKGSFKEIRPSQIYLLEKGILENEKEFFMLSPEQKRIFLQKQTEISKDSLKYIYPLVLEEWINESGYSFPSGHSQTAFFLGTILAFVLIRTTKSKILFIIPFIWAILVCISRVVIGIHYPVDVAGGAAIGLILALSIFSFKKVNEIFE